MEVWGIGSGAAAADQRARCTPAGFDLGWTPLTSRSADPAARRGSPAVDRDSAGVRRSRQLPAVAGWVGSCQAPATSTVEVGVFGSARQTGRLVAATLVVAAMALAGCADSGSAPPPALPGQADTSGYDQAIANSPVADPASITPGSWADKIKQRGKLVRGGTDTGPLFSLKDPATGKVTGFDAGLAAMLAHYITGQTGDNTVDLVATTVDTRETLIQNGTVDAVFATYTITPRGPRRWPSRARTTTPATRSWSRPTTTRSRRWTTSTARRWPPRPTRPRRSRLKKYAPQANAAAVPGGRAVRGRRAAGARRGLRARPVHPALRREHEPGGQGGRRAVHPGALRDRPAARRPGAPSSSSTPG